MIFEISVSLSLRVSLSCSCKMSVFGSFGRLSKFLYLVKSKYVSYDRNCILITRECVSPISAMKLVKTIDL